VKVRSRLDPSLPSRKGVERHHLFPQNHLKQVLKISDKRQVNQIANMALVEWSDNIAVSDQPPEVYWPSQVAANRLSQEDLERQQYWHALPEAWTELSYPEFLDARRHLMAEVVRDAFARLAKDDYSVAYPASGGRTAEATLAGLIDGGWLAEGETLFNLADEVEAELTSDGRIEYDGVVYDSPDDAAAAATRHGVNGWDYWSVASDGDYPMTLAALRDAT
jgi:hypothetical protein